MAGVPLSKEIDLIHLWRSRSEWNSSLGPGSGGSDHQPPHDFGDCRGQPLDRHPPPKFLTVLLWTGLGGFTVAISPSFILGASFRRTTKAAALSSMIGSIAVYIYLITIGRTHPFPAVSYGLIVSLGLHLIVNPFTKPEPEEHLNRIFGKSQAR
jgi:hypothetical protein